MDKICDVWYSTYTKHYIPKPLENLRLIAGENCVKRVEYKEPIAETYRRYVTLEPSPTEKLSVTSDDYCKTACNTYPVLKLITEEIPPDKVIMKRELLFGKATKYQYDFCDIEKEEAQKEWERNNLLTLPLDVHIELTTQRIAFRHPNQMSSSAYEKNEVIKRPSSLDPNHVTRKILNVTTGDTEYMGRIGKLGKQIIVEQLHGIMWPK